MTATAVDHPIRRRIRRRVLLSLALLVPPTAQPDGGKTPWNRIDIAPTKPVNWMSYVNGATCDLGSDFRTLNQQ